MEEGTTGVAGDTMVTVRITETYDLSTSVNRMGIIGIHTPSPRLLLSLYPGFLTNYKWMHLDKCDVACACASVQPADPLQVGTEAGAIAPEDLFNPILYRAVSTDGYNTIVNRIYSYNYGDKSVATSGNIGSDAFPEVANQIDAYYSLLSEDGWRKAMPQSGFAMTSLKPFVYPLESTFGNTNIRPEVTSGTANPNSVTTTTASGESNGSANKGTMFRGAGHPMGRLPTSTSLNRAYIADNAIDQYATVDERTVVIPPTWVGCIVMPPAKLHKLYYRIRCTWTITFYDPISAVEKMSIPRMVNLGATLLHASEYTISASKMENHESMMDTTGMDNVKMVMQS